MQKVKPGKALDLGCGQGRNALFLAQQGFDVTAVDQMNYLLKSCKALWSRKTWICLLAFTISIHPVLGKSMISSYRQLFLMFLQADRIPAIIQNMQEQTSIGGYNLIVCAMDTEDYPCSVNFPFTFKEGELADYYKDWELIKYNENPGHLHRRDENGNRIQLRFATNAS